MAWRFKVSKYKNAAPKFPKKEELIQDIPVSDINASCGNHIKASCIYAAFNIDSGGGGNLGYLPLNASGRQGNTLPVIYAHADFVTDLDFSPFDDYLLATGSQDCKVNIWLLPDESSPGSLSQPVLSLPLFDRKIENVLWNPQADGILAITSHTTVKLYDITGASGQELFNISKSSDQIQSISWKGDGSLLVISGKDKKIRVIDPRSNSVVQEGNGHQNVKDSRVLWLAGKELILSTGFSQGRTREVKVWDSRQMSTSLSSLDIDSSTGTIMPLYDPDTNMTFLIGKGDTSLNFLELADKEPYLTPGGVDRTEQIKGAALVPKRAMNLMEAEVNRLLVLCRNSIIPATYIVPRKSYREFHSDLYPATQSGEPSLTSEQWLNGQTGQPKLVSLQPCKQLIARNRRGLLLTGALKGDKLTSKKEESQEESSNPVEKLSKAPDVVDAVSWPDIKPGGVKNESQSQNAVVNRATASVEKSKDYIEVKPNNVSKVKPKPEVVEKPMLTPKPVKAFTGVRQSKVRHIQGQLLHPSCFYTNVRNVCKTMPGESDMFAANVTRCVVPTDSFGGCLIVFEFSKATRLPDTGVPVIQNGSKVADFAWDPFDDSRLVVVTDNAKINVWTIPDGGITQNLEQPDISLKGHMEKIYFVSFHPHASNLIMTASYDMTVRLWDLKQQKEVLRLEGHDDQVFCLSWSSDGRQCATVCKDGLVRIFEPRRSLSPLRKGPGPAGIRGARVEWVLQDKHLVVSGFDKNSLQQLIFYRVSDLEILTRVDIAVSPAILIPHYDPDTSVIFLTCRGERLIYTFEVSEEEPYLFECTTCKLEGLHQAVSYLPKYTCDVQKVEVMKAWRLTTNSIEAISFTVPRVKTEFFQDDLYPDTRVSWEATLTAEEWLAGKDKPHRLMSMKPSDMTALSNAPVEAPKMKKFESFNPDTYKTDEQKKEELLSAMVGKLEMSSEPLPQDLTEGVQDDEWDD
ncbi:coronin-7 [Biomphalaria pfeifferi]|uniref:Coronin n=1 Tax=Biomphalaria pfeifferi TaxID=112525 RepID=A0AAD8AXW5_BIOPF|nr:coronin-7 [Biomphalaria pfeifferi]